MAKIPIQGSTTDFYTVEACRLIGYDLGIPNNAFVIHRVLTTRSDRDAQVVCRRQRQSERCRCDVDAR